MSWLSSALGDVGNVVKGVGHAAGSVLSNPLVDAGLAFIPGVGPLAAGAAGALGGALKPGGNFGSTLTGGLEGAASGLAGGAARGALGIGGAAAPAGVSALGASSAIPDAAMGLGGAAGAAAGTGGAGGLLGGIEGLAGQAGNFLTGNGGKNALGIAQGVNAALQQKKSTDYAKDALGSVEAAYNAKSPLRAQGLGTLAGTQAGNPYATGTPNAALQTGGY